MPVIDAHCHWWALDTAGHQWPTASEAILHRDFGGADLAAATQGVPLAGVVLVQSQPTDADTDWLLATAEVDPRVMAVVGWVNLASPTAPARIAALADRPKLRGLRPMLQAIADTDWLLRDDLAPALRAMCDHGLSFDALVQPRHLPMLARFVDRWPGLPVVIDHAAKPSPAHGSFAAWRAGAAWRADIATLAARGVWCKLSGLRTEQPAGAPAAALAPWIDHLVECFGDRLMWGSDWPVLLLSGHTYAQWLHDAEQLAGLHGPARDRLFGDAAREFYGSGDDR